MGAQSLQNTEKGISKAQERGWGGTVRILQMDKNLKVFQPQEGHRKGIANVTDYPHK